MARLARIIVPSLPHPVTQRANRRGNGFLWRWGLPGLSRSPESGPGEIRQPGLCLMSDPVHIVVVLTDADGLRCRSRRNWSSRSPELRNMRYGPAGF